MSEMESRRIVCDKQHQLAVLKTESGPVGDEFARQFIAQAPRCIYCSGPLTFEPCTLSVFENWASREDGRYIGHSAP